MTGPLPDTSVDRSPTVDERVHLLSKHEKFCLSWYDVSVFHIVIGIDFEPN